MSDLIQITKDTDMTALFAAKRQVYVSEPSTLIKPYASIIWTAQSGATVIIKRYGSETGKLWSFYIQAFDSYGFQREVNVHFAPRTGQCDNKPLGPNDLEVSIYTHPGRRTTLAISKQRVTKMIARFEYLLGNYPSLLFNKPFLSMDGRLTPRDHGFVIWHEMAHRGALDTKVT